jgi:hypothetical protein
MPVPRILILSTLAKPNPLVTVYIGGRLPDFSPQLMFIFVSVVKRPRGRSSFRNLCR